MVEKYRRITFKILLIIPVLASVFYMDVRIFPRKKVNDTIESYSIKTISHRGRFSSQSSETMRSYKFYTQNGHTFSTEKRLVDEYEVTLELSSIFKIVTSVKSKTKDYSNKLVSGLNGLILWLTNGLLLSTLISLLLLRFKKELSPNAFYNIILWNSFLAFLLLYFLFFQN